MFNPAVQNNFISNVLGQSGKKLPTGQIGSNSLGIDIH